ncbi:GNAT family N-acetyltransferase [Streptomyces hygroscopicus]|uniref:GNAT family N-acetyltransferase n=1 Tax=Streptomyces hygroscopicus TaxID=1912 RepID=UPI0007864967|nr:GNAT family N-acetyltransferase [Streptomyces hygroscopicus]
MPAVRLFRREDRDQLTELINAHAAAVVPGVSVSVNTVLSRLERRPDEFVTDPWVRERMTLVAEHRRCVVAAAHLLRYRDEAGVGADYRDAGAIDWFVCRPSTALLPQAGKAADLLMSAGLAQFARWNVRTRYGDGALPVPGVYGLPRAWPHIRAAYQRAGFRHTGDTEVLFLARVEDLPRRQSRSGVTIERTVGECGTRFTACAGRQAVGFIEVDTAVARPERLARTEALAELADLHIDSARQGEGWERLLLAHAADWLRLCGADRLLAYACADDGAETEQLLGLGFRELTRTDRGWVHRP